MLRFAPFDRGIRIGQPLIFYNYNLKVPGLYAVAIQPQPRLLEGSLTCRCAAALVLSLPRCFDAAEHPEPTTESRVPHFPRR